MHLNIHTKKKKKILEVREKLVHVYSGKKIVIVVAVLITGVDW